MLRAVTKNAMIAFVLASVLACGSDDSGGGGGSTSGGSGGIAQGGSGGIAQGGSGGSVTGGAAGTAAGGTAGVTWGPYPAGPYGHNVGDTIADLKWEGYVNETGAQPSDTLPYVDYGTDAMRKSGKAYGLIHLSAFL